MPYTLLELVDQACGEMGLAQPTSVIGSANNQTVQLRSLAQRLGKDLIREYEWQRLVKVHAGTTQELADKTGDITIDSFTITGMSDTNSISVGDIVSGSDIPPFTEIASIDTATQITITAPASATSTGVTLSFARQDRLLTVSDIDRLVSDTFWDRTNHWRNQGPVSSQGWQSLQSGILLSTGSRIKFRVIQGKLRMTPAPTTPINIVFEYVSTYWVIPAGFADPAQEKFLLDGDTCVFPDDLMLAGLKYYFRRAKGLDWGPDQEEYERILAVRKAQDVPATVLSATPYCPPELLTMASVPDGSWWQ